MKHILTLLLLVTTPAAAHQSHTQIFQQCGVTITDVVDARHQAIVWYLVNRSPTSLKIELNQSGTHLDGFASVMLADTIVAAAVAANVTPCDVAHKMANPK